MIEKLNRTKRILEHKGAIVDMYADYIEMPDGRTVQWDYIEHRKGAAAVLPVLANGNLVLVKQYRNALDRITIEIPAGSRDSTTEDTMVCAKRELEEETGYRCETIEKLLSIKTTVAFCNEFIDIYLARGLVEGEQKLDEDEFIEIIEMPLEEALELIYDGTMQDSKTVSAILAYAYRNKS